MKLEPHSERLSVVVIGQFNPSIVSPAWLEKEELISPEAAGAAKLEIVAPEIASFDIGERKVQVLRDRMLITTADAREQETIRDLACGILELLSHTPTSKVGLNYEASFVLASDKSWHDKGHQLAPKEHWNGVLRKPGLVNITMRDNCRDNGYLDVKVGPAQPPPKNLISIAVNDHYELDPSGAIAARTLVMSNWFESLARSRRIAEALAGEGVGTHG
ncbi:hypothetical protein ACFL5O_10695 [Myxococcota bacterium]